MAKQQCAAFFLLAARSSLEHRFQVPGLRSAMVLFARPKAKVVPARSKAKGKGKGKGKGKDKGKAKGKGTGKGRGRGRGKGKGKGRGRGRGRGRALDPPSLWGV